MKKLMIAAAGAAVGLSAMAVYTPEFYEMNITVKTTTCKAGQGKNVCDDDYTTYRVKATQKITGVIWGCDCPTIASPKAFETFDDFGTENACHGYVFWDASVKTKDPYETATFAWEDAAGNYTDFLQCINPKCTDCEGVWTLSLADSDGNALASLQGAGVGSACWSSEYLAAYIKSMSGNVTGWAFPGSLSYGCAACGETYVGCSAWAFCTACDERADDYPSAAYGTWTLKFNSSAAKKYAKGTTGETAVFNAYKFSDAVKAYLVKVDQGESSKTTVVDNVTKYYNTCKAAVADAEEDVADAKADYAEALDANLKVNEFAQSYAWARDVREIEVSDAGAITVTYSNLTHQADLAVKIAAYAKVYNEATFEAAYADWTTAANAFIADCKGKLWFATGSAQENYGNLWIAQLTKYYQDKATYELESEQIAYKQNLEIYRTVTSKDLSDNTKNLAATKKDFNTSIGDLEAVARTALREAVAALEAFAADSEAVNVPYSIAAYDWDTGTFITEDGTDLQDGAHATELAKFQADTNKAFTDATTAYSDAGKALKTAKDNLSQAETACLITKGSKDCK